MINKTKQSLPNRLPQELADMKRELAALKQKQLLGGDNLVVTPTNTASTSLGSLAAGDTIWVSIVITPTNQLLTLWDFRFSVFVDGGGPYLSTNLLPFGSSLPSSVAKLIRVSYIPDWASSSDSIGLRRYYIGITNADTSAHTISFQATAYSIKTPTS